MDSWSAIQLKKMQAGGNKDLNDFLKVRSQRRTTTTKAAEKPRVDWLSLFLYVQVSSRWFFSVVRQPTQ